MSSMAKWLYVKGVLDDVTADIETEVRETVFFLEQLTYGDFDDEREKERARQLSLELDTQCQDVTQLEKRLSALSDRFNSLEPKDETSRIDLSNIESTGWDIQSISDALLDRKRFLDPLKDQAQELLGVI